MGRRELEPTERLAIEKQMPRFERVRRILWARIRGLDHMINFELSANFEEKMEELKLRKRQFEDEYRENEINIINLRDQLENGVLTKEENQNGTSNA